jgi:hypothetical protein
LWFLIGTYLNLIVSENLLLKTVMWFLAICILCITFINNTHTRLQLLLSSYTRLLIPVLVQEGPEQIFYFSDLYKQTDISMIKVTFQRLWFSAFTFKIQPYPWMIYLENQWSYITFKITQSVKISWQEIEI